MAHHSNDQQYIDKELPQPHNSNHISTAPLRDKLLTNSSYLAAEIPLKLGHFMSNLWISGSELSSSFFLQNGECNLDPEDAQIIWLLGCPYHSKPLDPVQQAIMDAQKDEMFRPGSDREDQEEVLKDNASLVWPPDFYDDFTSRLWMTYRHNYPPIRPSNHKTDIGWGCMLRSGQSLLANTLLVHFLSRGKQLGKNIGEWFGPSTISQVIQALVSDFQPADLSVYVATDGTIYLDGVQDVTTGKKPRGDFSYLTGKLSSDSSDEGREEAKHLYDASSTPQQQQQQQQEASSAAESHNGKLSLDTEATAFKPVLMLVALRLGIDSLHTIYHPALKACFELPSFVGIAGGRPNSSLYFIGLQGDDLIYLDPHFSRPALETKRLSQYTNEDFSTYHCTIPRKISISNLDPSMMLGFYCRNQKELDLFCDQIKSISQKHSAIFSIQQSAPEYDEDVRSENDFGVMSDEDDDDDQLKDQKCRDSDEEDGNSIF
ncbi:hypothetical protein [Parasitella parasitica]|uniref:Cysteine protease n=1 Tax=Parasitella parasitica TaxID=35722 RepID=A0A0B7NH12_9FUNG|nr:hypothetical protein [Parasitella parasitica]